MRRSRLGPLRAEARKACAPLLLVVALLFACSVWRDYYVTATFLPGQATIALVLPQEAHSEVVEACGPGRSRSRACAMERQAVAANENLIRNSRWMGRVGEALRQPVAIVQFVAHQMIAGFGWLIVAWVAMVLVAGEGARRTSEEATRLLGRRTYLVTKVAAVATLATLIMGAAIVALIAHHVVPTEQGVIRGSFDADPAWISWPRAAVVVLASIVVSVMVAAIAVPFAARSRSMHWFGIGALIAVTLVFAVSRLSRGASWAPMTIVDRALHLGHVPPITRDVRIWDDSSRSGDLDELGHPHSGSPVMVALLLAVWTATARWAARRFIRLGVRR